MDAALALILDGYRQVHQRMRAELAQLDPAEIHLVLVPETSSIAMLVRHALGSEGDVLRAVAGQPSGRDRAVEFGFDPVTVTHASLRLALDDADRLLDEVGPRLTAARLTMVIERPPRPPRTGLGWLIENVGHAREHLAHLELTRQLLTMPRP